LPNIPETGYHSEKEKSWQRSTNPSDSQRVISGGDLNAGSFEFTIMEILLETP